MRSNISHEQKLGGIFTVNKKKHFTELGRSLMSTAMRSQKNVVLLA